MTTNRRPTEPTEQGGLEVASPSLGRKSNSAGNGQGGNSADGARSARNSGGGASAGTGAGGGASAGNGAGGGVSAGNGAGGGPSGGNGARGGASVGNAGGGNGSGGGVRTFVPPDLLESLREQVADFADFAHRTRSKIANELTALGSGGGLTAQVVRAMAAEIIRVNIAPWLGADEQAVTDALMLSLVAPREIRELTESQRASFVVTQGQLMIDVSTAELREEKPVILVAPPAPLGPAEQPADGGSPPAAPVGGESPPPAATVFVGAAAAAERPFVGVNSVMSRARSAIFEQVSSAGGAQDTGAGLRAASKLEIVVLLDEALGGGLWIDVNPKTGHPEAALAIELRRPPERIRFTHVLLHDPAERRMVAAGRTTEGL
jgi:hypothetical protein